MLVKATLETVGFFATKFKLYLALDANIGSYNLIGDITIERMVVDYLTMPFIWTEKARMVKGGKCLVGVAASPYLVDNILEPKAASIYCQQKSKRLKLKKKTNCGVGCRLGGP